MPYHIHLERFQGPLDLLLQLVEEDDFDITEVSLAQVAQQYLQYLEEQTTEIQSDELADFLLVAAKLVFLKSRTLLPGCVDDEDGEETELALQLQRYRVFVQASHNLQRLFKAQECEYTREYPLRDMRVSFSPPVDVTREALKSMFVLFRASIRPLVHLEERVVKAGISLHEQVELLRAMLQDSEKIIFRTLIEQCRDRTRIVTHFLALLELLKEQEVQVQQKDLFADIVVFSGGGLRVKEI